MIPAAAWAVVLSGLLGSTEAGYDVGLRAEMRADSALTGFGLDGAQEIDPRIAMLFHDDEWIFTAAYSPRVYWLEPQDTPAPSVMHRANLALERKVGTNQRIFASEDFGYGLNYFSPLGGAGGAVTSPGTPPPLQLVPSVLFAQYVSSASTAGTTLQLAPLWTLNAQAAWVVTGGADPTAQEEIPLERGPTAQASLAYAISRLDTLTTTVSGVRASFTPGQVTLPSGQLAFSSGQIAELAQATETWHTQLTRTVDASLQGGAAVAQNQLMPVATPDQSVLPIAGANLNLKTRIADKLVSGSLSAQVGPFLDVFAAEVFERAEGALGARFNYEHWDIKASVRGTVLLNGGLRQGESLVTAELSTAHAFDKGLVLEGGLRAYWQNGQPQDPLVAGSAVAGTIFVAFTADAKGVVGG
jgi:hypothetical protein